MMRRLLATLACAGLASSMWLPLFAPAGHTTPPTTNTTIALTHLDPVQRYQHLDPKPTTSPRREVVKVTARARIVRGGTKARTPAARAATTAPATPRRAPATRSYKRPALAPLDLGTWRVTKYCSTGNRTASGVWPAIGQAATLNRGIPFGTVLRVVGQLTTGRHIDQTFIVTDRIGHGSQLDLYAGGENDPTCEPRVNREWGLQHLDVQEIR